MGRTQLIIILPWVLTFAFVVWETRRHDRALFGRWLQGEHEPTLLAVREWFKALGFLAASIAAIFAFWQFDLADRRYRFDQRPWVSLDGLAVRELEVGPSGLAWSLTFRVKNSGSTPALHVAVEQEAMIPGGVWYPAEITARACSGAEQKMAALVVFPKDDVPLGIGNGRISNEQIEAHNKIYKTQPTGLAPLIVICVAYRSPLDEAFHHTLYLAQMEANVTTKMDLSTPRQLEGQLILLQMDRINAAD